MNMIVKGKLFVAWILLTNIFFSCGSSGPGDKEVFRYNEQDGIATLDPAFAKNRSIIWAIHQLYNTLVETDDALNIAPSLAYRWDISADRKIYTFHLRKGVYFHDDDAFPGGKGRLFTAADVVYSFQRIVD